ncbi:MAG: galactose oxidase-like domain-containing protein [Gemmatimonadales bacterium]
MTNGSARAVLLAAALAGCQENTPPSPSDDAPQVSVLYVCGNRFDLENRNTSSVTIRYEVMGSSEQGELLLPPAPDRESVSVTRLVTLHSGTIRLFHRDKALSPVDNPGTACPEAAPEAGPAATSGHWDTPLAWPVVAVHLHLLPSGKVLSWGAVGTPQVWNPETGEFTPAPSSTMLFCSGHAFLPNGNLLVAGGHIAEHRGLPDANLFDPMAQTWISAPSMSRGRWYPTSTTLADGRVLTLGGRDGSGTEVDVPEVWTGSAWQPLPGARRALPYYPRTFVAPHGLVFYAGELRETAYLDPEGSGHWTPVAASRYGRRDYGSAVMYRPGKVMIVGGSDPPEGTPTNTAEVIDLGDPAPGWQYTGPMAHPRRQLNTTLLPDGRVLATGGTSAAGFSNPAGAVRVAEVWDPLTGDWQVLAGNRVTRVYHSSTLLLPDGRVLHAGSGDGAGLPRELSAEIFSPPYLFRGRRPVIAEAPATVSYGQQFFVRTPDAGLAVRATLVRLGSVTHGFDQNQRFLELALQRTAAGLSLKAPSTGDLAPPGDYLLFIVSDAGVPSVARMVRLG